MPVSENDICKLYVSKQDILICIERALNLGFEDNLRKRHINVKFDSKLRGYLGEVAFNNWLKRFGVFYTKSNQFNVKKIVVSGSDLEGEGEHKIFDYIRNNSDIKSDETVIYGLDADLIMLTINNLSYCDKMYLFRETPDFIRSIDKSLDPNYLYVIDIPLFKNQLTYYLNNDKEAKTENEKNKVYDYIFLCFMLGNDFLPHFPALNIRTNGITILLETYRNILGNKSKNIIENGNIIWKNFRLLIKELSDNEEENIQYEYKLRNRMEKINRESATPYILK